MMMIVCGRHHVLAIVCRLMDGRWVVPDWLENGFA
jgi:hypothetical protein